MNQACTHHASSRHRRDVGFTLIEVMITVAIVAILAAIALPAYMSYVIRGKLVYGTNDLASLRAQMEQFYQDNRTYQTITTVTPNITSPCGAIPTPPSGDLFTLTCPTLTATTYVLRATGSGQVNGAIYTVDNQNNMATTGLPTSWGAVPSNAACWIMRKGDSC
jgi:type IV pilus assembly protein PilE